MIEPELLENLSKLERESKVLEIKIKVWKDEKGKLDLIKRNEEVKAEIEKLKRNLASVNGNKGKDSQEVMGKEESKDGEKTRSLEKTKTTEEFKVANEPKNTEKTKEEKSTIDKEVVDNGQKQFSESELLTDLSKLERTSRVLEIKIKVWKDEKGKLDLIKQNEETKAEIEKLKRDLASIKENKEKDSGEAEAIEELKGNEAPKNGEEVSSNNEPDTFEELKDSKEPKPTTKSKIEEEIKGNEEETIINKEINDNSHKQLTELELLKTLSQLEKESQTLEIKIKTGNEEKGKITWKKQNEVIKEKIDKLRKNLISLNDKRYGEEAKSAIIRQLKENILEINDSGKEKLEKQLFEKKFRDLFFLVAEKVSGVSAPDFSSYKTGGDNPIDTKELSDFLIQEIQTVTNLDEPSYSNLREYLAGLKVRIIKRFIE